MLSPPGSGVGGGATGTQGGSREGGKEGGRGERREGGREETINGRLVQVSPTHSDGRGSLHDQRPSTGTSNWGSSAWLWQGF